MDRLSKITLPLFCIGAFLALLSTLEPWYVETFGEKEEKIDEKAVLDAKLQAEKDAKACRDYPVKYIDNVLYCKCTETESQRPGKCQEKYKND